MIQGKSVLAIIPARGGSKGVPRKNVLELAGKPLIGWTIDEARKSQYIDRLVLSSDDQEIQEVAIKYGCEVPFNRPSELAQDDTPGVLPVLHAVRKLQGYDYVILLQPTSPLRTVEDIDGCLELCLRHLAPSCVSITAPDKSPFWMFSLNDEKQLVPFLDKTIALRRQELRDIFALNGAVYVIETNHLLATERFIDEKSIGYTMPRERSIDIDTALDFRICEAIIEGNKLKE